jgi:hypothetical protein
VYWSALADRAETTAVLGVAAVEQTAHPAGTTAGALGGPGAAGCLALGGATGGLLGRLALPWCLAAAHTAAGSALRSGDRRAGVDDRPGVPGRHGLDGVGRRTEQRGEQRRPDDDRHGPSVHPVRTRNPSAAARPTASTTTRSQAFHSTVRERRTNPHTAVAAVATERVIAPSAVSRRSHASQAPMPTTAATAGASATV